MTRPPLALLLTLALAGCPHGSPVAPPRGTTTWDVAVVASSSARVVTSVYAIEARSSGPGVLAFRTLHSEGSWEERGSALVFDSDQPRGSDPWPLSLQHAVSSVPARVRLDETGAPLELVDEAGWREAALEAVEGLNLPPQAAPSAAALVDPQGLVRDLRRSFPGLPPVEASWTRSEVLAGVPAQRVERCAETHDGSTRTWTCTGEVQGTSDRVRLDQTTTTTVLEADAQGLLRYESTYEGFVVLMDPDGHEAVRRAVVGRRLVSRR